MNPNTLTDCLVQTFELLKNIFIVLATVGISLIPLVVGVSQIFGRRTR